MIYNIGIIWPILSPQTGLRVQLVFSEAKVVCLIVSMKFVGYISTILMRGAHTIVALSFQFYISTILLCL